MKSVFLEPNPNVNGLITHSITTVKETITDRPSQIVYNCSNTVFTVFQDLDSLFEQILSGTNVEIEFHQIVRQVFVQNGAIFDFNNSSKIILFNGN